MVSVALDRVDEWYDELSSDSSWLEEVVGEGEGAGGDVRWEFSRMVDCSGLI